MFENKPEKEEGGQSKLVCCVITCSPCEISLSAQRTAVTQSMDTALLAIHTHRQKQSQYADRSTYCFANIQSTADCVQRMQNSCCCQRVIPDFSSISFHYVNLKSFVSQAAKYANINRLSQIFSVNV